ncbi:MAG: AzlC family ABC transporter permease, partial [Ktedonobacterales bacterium]
WGGVTSMRVASEKVSFTLPGALRGARCTLPICAGDFAVGAAFGVLARHTGLSATEATLMSALVFAGASQFVALTLWVAPLPVVALILTTFVVNIRHVLMGATLRPWFRHLAAIKAYGSVFFMVDESWAVTIAELRKGGDDTAFLIGSGGALFLAWVSATFLGATAGALLPASAQVALGFAFTAVFVALLTGMWRGKADLLPWLVAAGVAVAAANWLPGKWYIVLGGLAGSVIGALRDAG